VFLIIETTIFILFIILIPKAPLDAFHSESGWYVLAKPKARKKEKRRAAESANKPHEKAAKPPEERKKAEERPKVPKGTLNRKSAFQGKGFFDIDKIRKAVETEAKQPEIREEGKQYIRTGIKGFDDLFEKGIPKGNATVIAGGCGSGKTIMCLQILTEAARKGQKCLYMSFEESEDKLRQHMNDFGWNPHELEKKGTLVIKRFSIFDIARSIDALLAKRKGELLIDVKPVILPDGFKPDLVVVDSLTAIASAFVGSDTYRSYIEQLFRFLEEMRTTAFLITETEQIPKIFSPTGVEEFLADGVVVLYNIRKGDIRENAIEVLKMRGTRHKKKIVAMQVTSRGMEVFPEQEVFSGIDNEK
jgi:KaiC/GvpD/RAD55 family RecA-like ATPase